MRTIIKKVISKAFVLSVTALMLLGSPLTLFADGNAILGGGNSAIGGGYNPLGGPPYPLDQNSYFTDDYGNILMFVNVLGEVGRPGQFIVRENSDFTTILAITGGLRDDANLKKVLVIRHEPDETGKQVYVVNLKSFYKKGDTSEFIAFKPNDTIIIPDKAISLTKIAQVMSVAFPVINLYDIINRNK
jgi:hypothetical protein